MYNKKCQYIAGWSSWQLVGLITRRSKVRVLPPQPKHLLESQEIADSYFFAKFGYIKNIGHLMGTNLYKKVFGKP